MGFLCIMFLNSGLSSETFASPLTCLLSFSMPFEVMFITSTVVMDKATAKNVSLRRDFVLVL